MRTTITLDPDVAALVRTRMRERGQTFTAAVNEALREALGGRTPVRSMGQPAVSLDHALRVAAELEDAEVRQKPDTGR